MTMRAMLLVAGLYLPAMGQAWEGPKQIDAIPGGQIPYNCGPHLIWIVESTPYRQRRNGKLRRVHKTAEIFSKYVCPNNAPILDIIQRSR